MIIPRRTEAGDDFLLLFYYIASCGAGAAGVRRDCGRRDSQCVTRCEPTSIMEP